MGTIAERLKAAIELRTKLHAQMGAILQVAKDANRDTSEEESKTYDDLDEKWQEQDTLATKLQAEQKRHERNQKREDVQTHRPAPVQLATPGTMPTGPTDGGSDTPHEVLLDDGITVHSDNIIFDPYGGFGERGFGQFALDVRGVQREGASQALAHWHNNIQAAVGDGMASNTGHDGGYLIPTEFRAQILEKALEAAVIRPRAMVIPMTTRSTTFRQVDDTTHAGNTVFGGVQAFWKSEEAQLTSSKPKFNEVQLDLHKLTALSFATGDMLDWSPLAIDSWLPTKLAQAMAWKEDDKFINGVGASGEPTGILNCPAIISIAKETGQSAATILYENLLTMWSRVWMATGNLVWIANRTVLKQLATMTLNVGTGGVPVYLPANGAVGSPLQGSLLGIPIVFTEHAKALGTTGDIYLANLSEYIIGDAAGKTRSDRSIHLKFDFDQVTYRIITWSGGICPWRTAFTPQNGDTLSPIMKLDART